MFIRDALRSPYAVPAVFFAVAIVSTTALGWLVSEQFRQDAIVEAERQRAALVQAAERISSSMQRSLFEVEALIRSPGIQSAAVPTGLTLLSIGADAVMVNPQGSLLFVPMRARSSREAPVSAFAAAERLEFEDGGRDQTGALRAYRELARSADPAIRALALTRAARVHRRLEEHAAALDAYAQLAAIDDATVDGLPPALIAAIGRLEVYERVRDARALASEAEALEQRLATRSWPLLRPEYEFYLGEVTRRLGRWAVEDRDARARAEAAGWLWQQRAALPAAARRVIPAPHGPSFALWAVGSGEIRAVVGGPTFIGSFIAENVPSGLAATLTTPDGANLFGSPLGEGAVEVRAAATGLPWSLHLRRAAGTTPQAGGRRRLLLLVFGTVALVTISGGFFIVRGIRRELRVMGMQSDFVAAVSHEFRSPLSSMYQIAQMLASDRFPSDAVRRTSYDVLVRETERLRQLVEGLLDFGRFERSGSFRFEHVNATELVRATVAEFRERAVSDGYAVELSCASGDVFVRADREALVRALWNLLDNAVKYSPDCRTVWVDVEADTTRIRIAVRDHGIGIPADEQAKVFERFVRGSASKTRRIKGTGIGLAMVRHIIEAHGGQVRLTSDPGSGSCFTMELQTNGGQA